MDLHYTPEEEAFRARVRDWIEKNRPPAGVGRHDMEELLVWQRRLHDAGYLGAAWPREHGGGGLSDIEQAILNEEFARAHTPTPPGSMGISWVGPAILRFGSDEQKRRFVPRLLSGEDIWATGYSEPGAGSDMYNTQTRAVRDGDHFVINGRRSGRAWPTPATGTSCWSARASRATRWPASRSSWCPWTRRASRCAPPR